jgi:hypothetical protein
VLAFGLLAVGAAVVGVLLVPVLDTDRQPVRHHRGGGAVIAFAISIAVVVAVVVVVAVIVRRASRGTGMFGIPLAAGLPSAERRRAYRAVRHGVPSGDPALAAAELDAAQRTARYGRPVAALCGACAAADLVQGLLLASAPAMRGLWLGSAVLFAAVASNKLWTARAARRYLANAAD